MAEADCRSSLLVGFGCFGLRLFDFALPFPAAAFDSFTGDESSGDNTIANSASEGNVPVASQL
jgi:hypothetical protein